MNNPIDQIFDENNQDNIVLYNENGDAVEFEQIALVPRLGKVYVILKPAVVMEGMGEDEALVLAVEEVDGEECLVLVEEDEVIDAVFSEYYELLREEGLL